MTCARSIFLSLVLPVASASAVAVGARAHASETPSSAKGAPSVDVSLESSRGGTRLLSSYRGRVAVLFYEDRHHTETNAGVKEAVARYGLEHRLQNQVEVVAVANLKGYDFAPASTIARKAIRTIANRFGIEILMDWRGAAIDSLGAKDANANVIVIDRAGVVRFRAAGRLGDDGRKALLAAVTSAL
jgi:hypothetical protein